MQVCSCMKHFLSILQKDSLVHLFGCFVRGTLCSVFLMAVCFHFYREDKEARFLSSRMAIVAAFRSWSGKASTVIKTLFPV